MNMIFFNSNYQLAELLAWTIAITNLQFTQTNAKLRRCCLEHARWLETTTK